MVKYGWIHLHRKIQDCWLWGDKPYDRARAWIDLLLLANHHDTKIMLDGRPVTIVRGQYVTSIVLLSERWGWSRNKTKRFFDVLECDGMVTTKRTNKRTIINIVNYDVYQLSESEGEPTDEPTDESADEPTDESAERHQKDIKKAADEPQNKNEKNEYKNDYKNDKNEKEYNNIYIKGTPLGDALEDFVKMRKTIKAPMTDLAMKRLKSKLEKYSGGDVDIMIEILNKSTDNCWKGVFPLEKNFKDQEGNGNVRVDEIVEPDESHEMTDEEFDRWVDSM